MYEGHPENKEQYAQLFSRRRSSVSGVQCDVEKLPHAVVRRTLSRGKCRDSCSYFSVQSESDTVGPFPVSKK